MRAMSPGRRRFVRFLVRRSFKTRCGCGAAMRDFLQLRACVQASQWSSLLLLCRDSLPKVNVNPGLTLPAPEATATVVLRFSALLPWDEAVDLVWGWRRWSRAAGFQRHPGLQYVRISRANTLLPPAECGCPSPQIPSLLPGVLHEAAPCYHQSASSARLLLYDRYQLGNVFRLCRLKRLCWCCKLAPCLACRCGRNLSSFRMRALSSLFHVYSVKKQISKAVKWTAFARSLWYNNCTAIIRRAFRLRSLAYLWMKLTTYSSTAWSSTPITALPTTNRR